jgi:hypothetical protein
MERRRVKHQTSFEERLASSINCWMHSARVPSPII